jgi:hypothetical protein
LPIADRAIHRAIADFAIGAIGNVTLQHCRSAAMNGSICNHPITQ